MSAIKPIETVYEGCNFRSRLEARWAVFFNSLGIRYQYEPEAFDFGGGLVYLPDFWLPDLEIWIEVKPDDPDRTAFQKAHYLSCERLECVLMLCGDPWPGNYNGYFWGFIDREDSIEPFEGDGFVFALGRRDEREIWISSDDYFPKLIYSTRGDETPDRNSERWPLTDSPRLLAAYKAARSERFDGWWRNTRTG